MIKSCIKEGEGRDMGWIKPSKKPQQATIHGQLIPVKNKDSQNEKFQTEKTKKKKNNFMGDRRYNS